MYRVVASLGITLLGVLPAVPVAELAVGFGCLFAGANTVSAAGRDIPRTWDQADLSTSEVPLADARYSPVHVPENFYYAIPERPIYKSYPVYAPGREPAGYWQKLLTTKPEILWGKDSNGKEHHPALRTKEDWVRAGELVFDAAIAYSSGPSNTLVSLANVRDSRYYETMRPPLSSDGRFVFGSYVIRELGKVELGQVSCGMCHTRVLPDGSVIKGAQGNLPFDRSIAFNVQETSQLPADLQEKALNGLRRATRTFFGMPWAKPDPAGTYATWTLQDVYRGLMAIPPGVIDRQGSSALYPVQIPDLIGIKDRLYLDHTGLQRHRGIGDIMRYGALNQDMNLWGRYGSWIPGAPDGTTLPPAAKLKRYSDEQLYALGLFLYSLRPPANPNKTDTLAAAGKAVFARAGCGGCHTKPLYTNNKLTPAQGFVTPSSSKDRVMPISVGTDPRLAMQTRRGTGYYKVPSLKGLWYRGPLEHSGSVSSLEDWFNPARLREDYVPTGFIGAGIKSRAVKGHEFGLELGPNDRAALIAFLRTL